MVAAVFENELPVILTSAAGPADIGREHEITVANEKLDKRVPGFGILAVHRVAKQEQSGMTGLWFPTPRLVNERLHFRTIEAAVRDRIGPHKPGLTPKFVGHGIRGLCRACCVDACDPQVRRPARIRMREGDLFAVR